MTKDTIQERTRALADYNERQLYPENRCDTVDELREAADRIDALEAENARLAAQVSELERQAVEGAAWNNRADDAFMAENARLREERDEALAKFNHEAWLSEKRALERNHAEADVARLTARIAELEEALRPFAETAIDYDEDDRDIAWGERDATAGRRARQALEG